MRKAYGVTDGATVVIGMDLRPSSPQIAAVISESLEELGFRVEFSGLLPTPALALRCLQLGCPGIMVTGSHIPFDRNGMKFYSPAGEILKEDERAMLDYQGFSVNNKKAANPSTALPVVKKDALEHYTRRYLDYFSEACLAGQRIGVYEHSAVGRDHCKSLLQALGAEVIAVGRSDRFVPVDTEAVGEADRTLASSWINEHGLDALVSTDGDGDRPLVFDEQGGFVRGDLLGLVCARELGIRHLAVPVSCNTAIEHSGHFEQVVRTQIGSPFVIAAMQEMQQQGCDRIAGFEANGGFMLGSTSNGLQALPTRDALLPMLTMLVKSARSKMKISTLLNELPARFTHSDRLKDFATDKSRMLIADLQAKPELQARLADKAEPPVELNTTDGLRMIFADGEIIHLRPSGNAPELRCYAETDRLETAIQHCTGILAKLAAS